MIDATPKGPMPPLAMPAREYMEGARRIWKAPASRASRRARPGTATRSATGTRARTIFAARLVDGTWAQRGQETFASRRAGMTPERPTRVVEKGGN